MNKTVTAMLCAIVIAVAPRAWSQGSAADVTDMPALRTAVQADKKAFVAAKLQLTDAEAKKFWPLYDAYQRQLEMANRKRTVALEGLIGRDKPMSDLYARNLAQEMIAADEMELKARRTLHNRLMRALPPKKAARYLQLEAKIRDLQAYDIATTFPLLE
jgi:Spy/CpxP family protein refolding chaperone